MTAVTDGMDADLPNDIQQLKALLLQTQTALAVKETELASKETELALKEQETVELASTVSDQQQKLAAKEQQILELLKALGPRGGPLSTALRSDATAGFKLQSDPRRRHASQTDRPFHWQHEVGSVLGLP